MLRFLELFDSFENVLRLRRSYGLLLFFSESEKVSESLQGEAEVSITNNSCIKFAKRLFESFTLKPVGSVDPRFDTLQEQLPMIKPSIGFLLV